MKGCDVTIKPFSLAIPAAALGLALLVPATAQARVYEVVTVRGADLIPEDDIRQTCAAEPGAYIEDIEFPAIEDCLMSTAVFEAVSVTREGDALVITVTEIEQQPGRIEGAVSHVSDSGLTASLTYEQYNLIPDTFTAAHLDISRDDRRLSASLYRPDQWGDALDLGVDMQAMRTKYRDLTFRTQSIQAEVYVAWTPSDQVRAEYGVGLRNHRMFDVQRDASPLLQSETGRVTAPFLRGSLTWTSATDDTTPRPTYSARLDQHLWNLGTGEALSETRVELTGEHPLGAKTDLVLGLRGGTVVGLSGNSPRAIDRFFIGGEDFRGFAARGVGPADGRDMLGGDHFLIGSLELRRDLGEVFGTDLRGGVFVDVGSVWGLNGNPGGRIDSDWITRSSVGLSLTFDIDKTPVSLYVAEPLDRQPGDDRQSFGITISAAL